MIYALFPIFTNNTITGLESDQPEEAAIAFKDDEVGTKEVWDSIAILLSCQEFGPLQSLLSGQRLLR